MGLDVCNGPTSLEGHLIDFLLGLFVCLFVCQSFASFKIVRLGQLCYADKRIANITKVYVERNNLQQELMRYSKKN